MLQMTLNILGRIYLTSYSTECRGAYGEDLENRVHLLYSVAFVCRHLFSIFLRYVCSVNIFAKAEQNLQIYKYDGELFLCNATTARQMTKCRGAGWWFEPFVTSLPITRLRPIVISPIVVAPYLLPRILFEVSKSLISWMFKYIE